MRRHWLPTLTLLCGLLLITLSIRLPLMSSLEWRTITLDSLTEFDVSGIPNGDVELSGHESKILAEIKAEVTYPTEVAIDNTFLIGMHLQSVNLKPDIRRQDLYKLSIDTIFKKIKEIIYREGVAFRLDLAGTKISPSQPIRVLPEDRVFWSVRPDAAGQYAGAIQLVQPTKLQSYGTEWKFVDIQTMPNDFVVNVTVKKKLSYQVEWFIRIIGAILALPFVAVVFNYIKQK